MAKKKNKKKDLGEKVLQKAANAVDILQEDSHEDLLIDIETAGSKIKTFANAIENITELYLAKNSYEDFKIVEFDPNSINHFAYMIQFACADIMELTQKVVKKWPDKWPTTNINESYLTEICT